MGERRLEGRAKVTGVEVFAADEMLFGLVHTKLLLSPVAHGRITSIDCNAARAAPGVLAVVTGADLPVLADMPSDEPLARGTVHYAGQPVVAVVAMTAAQAADAVALLDLVIERLPAVVDPLAAMQEGSPQVLPDRVSTPVDGAAHGEIDVGVATIDRPHNATGAVRYRKGQPAQERSRAQAIASGVFEIAGVHQGFMEPHCCTAAWEDGVLLLWTSTQGRFLTRDGVAKFLGLESSLVRVMPVSVGGAFGGKLSPLLEPLVALLARQVGRPVRLELTRNEEFLMGRGAPAARVELELAGASDGELLAMTGRILFDCGAGLSGLGSLAGHMLAGTYRLRSYDLTCYDIATHKTPVTAYRAPAASQVYFPLEALVDELADKLGIDPIEIRLRNASRTGDPRPDGTVWPSIGLVECLKTAGRHPLLAMEPEPDVAVGVAVGGVRGSNQPAAAGCRLDADGSLVVQVGSVDLTGTDTTLAIIAAGVFGVPIDRVRVESIDTAASPFAGASAGSKVTYTLGAAVVQAAQEARKQLLKIAADEMEVAVEDLELTAGMVGVKGVPEKSFSVAELASLTTGYNARHAPVQASGRSAPAGIAPMFAVHLARVQVDRETGAWRVTDYAAIQDVGRALNPPEVKAQVHGGVVQGLGRAFGEQLVYDEEGQLRTATLVDYELPTVDQAPNVEVELVEVPSEYGPFGARGVGEPPVVPCAPAVANAIRRATGIRVRALPIGSETLVRELVRRDA